MFIRTTLCALLLASSASSASFDDVDWPCIQRKIPTLSIGQMWAGPLVDETIQAMGKEDNIRSLSGRMALRRTKLEDAQDLIDTFSSSLSGDTDSQLTALFAATFKKINRDRTAIVSGIARYSQKQLALTEQIDKQRAVLVELNAVDEPDYDKIEELEDRLAWDTRIFEDRKQSLTYVCETPVILEQRAFSLGRMIMEKLD